MSESKTHQSSTLTRRTFVNRTALGAAGLALTGGLGPVFAGDKGLRSRVVVARHPDVMDAGGKIQQPVLEEMLSRALTAFSGEKTANDAWRRYFTAEDVVGLKVNLNSARFLSGTDYLQHFSGLTTAIVAGLTAAGLKRGNMVIWERSEEELKQGGFEIQRETSDVRVVGTRESRRSTEGGVGFNKEAVAVGANTSRVARIVTDVCTALINIPVLKDHRISGLTGAMKNHYGSIDNPRDYHPNQGCNPGIPEVNKIPVIRKKEKLIIADALLCVYDGGPRWNRATMTPLNTIVVGTDPVAVDAVLLDMLDKERTARELVPAVHRAQFLEESVKLGLGTRDLDAIELVSI